MYESEEWIFVRRIVLFMANNSYLRLDKYRFKRSDLA